MVSGAKRWGRSAVGPQIWTFWQNCAMVAFFRALRRKPGRIASTRWLGHARSATRDPAKDDPDH